MERRMFLGAVAVLAVVTGVAGASAVKSNAVSVPFSGSIYVRVNGDVSVLVALSRSYESLLRPHWQSDNYLRKVQAEVETFIHKRGHLIVFLPDSEYAATFNTAIQPYLG